MLLLLTQFLPAARGARRRYQRIPPDLGRCLSQAPLISVPFTAGTGQEETPLPARFFSEHPGVRWKLGWARRRGGPLGKRGDFRGQLWRAQAALPARCCHCRADPHQPRDAPGAHRDAGGGSHAMSAAPGLPRSPAACHTFKGRRRRAAAACICRRNSSGGISAPLGWSSSARQKEKPLMMVPGWGRRWWGCVCRLLMQL